MWVEAITMNIGVFVGKGKESVVVGVLVRMIRLRMQRKIVVLKRVLRNERRILLFQRKTLIAVMPRRREGIPSYVRIVVRTRLMMRIMEK